MIQGIPEIPPEPRGPPASCTASEIVTVVPAVAVRVLESTASVPDTDAESATAPLPVARYVQLKETDAAAATFCVVGVGPEITCAAPVPLSASEGVSAFTPTPPSSVTTIVMPKTSPRSTADGAVSVAEREEGAWRAMALEVDDAAESAAPEFASMPAAPAESCRVAGGVPFAVKLQEKTAVLPAGTLATACDADAVRDPVPEAVATVGGS